MIIVYGESPDGVPLLVGMKWCMYGIQRDYEEAYIMPKKANDIE